MRLRLSAAALALGLTLAAPAASANTCRPPSMNLTPLTAPLGTDCALQVAVPAGPTESPVFEVVPAEGDPTPVPFTATELTTVVGTHSEQPDPCGNAQVETSDVPYRIFALTPDGGWPASTRLVLSRTDTGEYLGLNALPFDVAADAGSCPAAPDWTESDELDTWCQAGYDPTCGVPPEDDVSDDGCTAGSRSSAVTLLGSLVAGLAFILRRRRTARPAIDD